MAVRPVDIGRHAMTIGGGVHPGATPTSGPGAENKDSNLTEKLQEGQGKRRVAGGRRLDNFSSLGYWQMDEEERKGP